MPDKGKDRRTPEEVAAYYAAKAERIEKHYKEKEKRATKAKARRLHRKGRYNWEKLSAKKKAAQAALRPWDT